MSFLDLPGSDLEEIFLGLLMLPDLMFKGFHVVVDFLPKFIKVVHL